MNPEAYQAWLGQRDKHRETLFGDERKLDGQIRNGAGDVVGESLAAQALSKKLNGVANAETVLMDEAKQAVDAILAYHHEHAGEENTAIFGLADPPSDFDTVQEITAGVVAQWEKVCWRNKQPSPFEDLPISDIQAADFKQPSVQLVQ